MSDSKRLEVWTINKKEGQEKGYWCRIGSAFVNKDGSLNCFLDALPINGTMHIREPKERDDDNRGGNRGNSSSGRQSRGEDF